MDTITHALTGALVGYSGFRQEADSRLSRVALWTCVVASEFPDVDVILNFISGETFLRWHRGPTHSLVLLPFWAAFVAWVFWELSGRRRFRLLWSAALVSMAVHIALDLITNYGTMLLSPFWDTRFELGWVFIIDVYVWALLVAGLITVAVTRWRPAAARVTLGTFLVYVLSCGVSHWWALRTAPRTPDTVRVAAYPQPLVPWRWTIVQETPAAVSWINGSRNDTFTPCPDTNLVIRAEQTDAVRLFRWFAEFPLVECFEQKGFTVLRYRDLRFRSPWPGGGVREGTFVVAEAVFDRNRRLVTAGLTSRDGGK